VSSSDPPSDKRTKSNRSPNRRKKAVRSCFFLREAKEVQAGGNKLSNGVESRGPGKTGGHPQSALEGEPRQPRTIKAWRPIDDRELVVYFLRGPMEGSLNG